VGVHGGSLIGATATQLLQSADLIHKSHLEALRRYRPDGLPVTFDLQLEAEVMGCRLHWADELPPSVASHPLEGKDLSSVSFPACDLHGGRFPIVFEAQRRLRQHVGDSLAIYGLITGPLTLALHLRGNDLFYDMYDNPEGVIGLLSHCAEIGRHVAEAYIRHGADVIAVVDPMVSQVSAEHFDTFVAPAHNRIFDTIRSLRAHGTIFVCGDARRVLDKLFSTRCHSVSVDENIPLGTVHEAARRHGKSFAGNLKLTTVLLMGTEADARRHAVECLDIGGNIGYILSPGCDLPYGVPPENLEAVALVVHDPYQREVARTMVHISSDALHVGHGWADIAEEGVVIDVITLDSGACAPCQYMVDAARRAAATIGGPVFVREHKIKTREGLSAMCALNVTNIPTLCIDGDPVFVSIIPDQPTLIKAIKERMTTRTTR
jgi:uroporphyrinogen decarboxylase